MMGLDMQSAVGADLMQGFRGVKEWGLRGWVLSAGLSCLHLGGSNSGGLNGRTPD